MWILYFIVWLILCAVAGTIADKKGRMGWAYFTISFFLSPLVGILIAVAQSPITKNIEKQQIQSGEARKCPHCAELVKLEAKICKHCGKDLPAVEPMSRIDSLTGMIEKIRNAG